MGPNKKFCYAKIADKRLKVEIKVRKRAKMEPEKHAAPPYSPGAPPKVVLISMGVSTKHRGFDFCKVLESMIIAEMPAVAIGIVTPPRFDATRCIDLQRRRPPTEDI